MSDGANTQQAARTNWITPYSFEPWGGGEGIRIVANGVASAPLALVGKGNTLSIVVDGPMNVSLAFSAGAVLATTAYKRFIAGFEVVMSRPKDTSGTDYTHVSAITESGSSIVQITLGFGV